MDIEEATVEGEESLGGDPGTLREALARAEEELAASRSANRDAVEHLRAALVAGNPLLDPALIRGDTIDEVEASFATARELVERIRDRVRREQAAAIPAGAPARGATAPRSAIEKIREGLAKQAH